MEATGAPSPSTGPFRYTLRAKGALLQNAPSPNKTAGLTWKAPLTTDLGLMAGSPGSLMGLIGKAWPGRLAMLRWLTDETVAACPDAAELGAAEGALGDLPRQVVAGEVDVPAPLVQAAYSRESDYMEAFLLTPPTSSLYISPFRPTPRFLVPEHIIIKLH